MIAGGEKKSPNFMDTGRPITL